MIKFHSEPRWNVCEWRMIFFFVLITGVLQALRAGLMCMHITHLREPSTRGAGIPGGALGLACLTSHAWGGARSCLFTSLFFLNRIITALNGGCLDKSPPKVSKVRAQQLLWQLLSHRPLLLRDAGGVFVQGYHLPRWRVPPQLSPWNTKLKRLLQKQRPLKGRGREQP